MQLMQATNLLLKNIKCNTKWTLLIHWYIVQCWCVISSSSPEMNECIPCCSNGKNNRHEMKIVASREKGWCTRCYRRSFWWRWQLFNMNSYLHATIAETFATDKVVSFCYIQRNNISSCSPSPVRDWMFGVATFIICLVHFQYARLVPVIHKICKPTMLAWKS